LPVHLIFARDKHQSAHFLTGLFGLPDPQPAGRFLEINLDNGVTLQYAETRIDFLTQHYTFLVSDQEFDAIFARIHERGLPFRADPHEKHPDVINHGGRGIYLLDPSGHGLEVLTRPYGNGQRVVIRRSLNISQKSK
jgi:catechol 2,3-dioxygenase-like lactoylglutathione lyase family enzyme